MLVAVMLRRLGRGIM
jgi:hypothetical protein